MIIVVIIVTSVCPQRNTSSCVDVLVTVACFALNMSNQAVPQTCMDTLNPYMVSNICNCCEEINIIIVSVRVNYMVCMRAGYSRLYLSY